MRLDLYVTLRAVTGRESPVSGRPLVGLTWTADSQPGIGPLHDFYAVDTPETWGRLAQTARALGVELGTETLEDADLCASRLREAVGREAVVTTGGPRTVVGHAGWDVLAVWERKP